MDQPPARKVYVRPSAQELLQGAPARVGSLLAQYAKLVEGYAEQAGVTGTRTEVLGYTDPEDGSRQLMIAHLIQMPQVDAKTYRAQLGTAIEAWVRGLAEADLDLVQEWFILDVRTE